MTGITTPFRGIGRYEPDAPKHRHAPGAEPRMLALPEPGNRVALRWWAAGLTAYALLTVALVGALVTAKSASLFSLFGFGAQTNWATFVLVGSGGLLTAYTMWRAKRDIHAMAREEKDVEWVHTTGKPGLPLVFVDPKKRESMLGQPFALSDSEIIVETLMDDRVRRVRNAVLNPDAGAVVPDDLKGIAEVRTAQFGSFAPYASSLLLLLAVLGTFAGVKTALPGLIESITASTATADATTAANAGLIRSLNAVAEAFGGNALALIGAIAVGLMAQGIGFGRRNLLERLELVSAEFLYGQSVTTDANPMQAAMVALRDTAREMHSASGAMLGIEDQLQQLGREFRTAFDSLANRLHDIATGQEEALHRHTADSLDVLQQRVNDLADSVEANARTYAGLAEAVKSRSQEAGKAFDAMAESNKQLGVALESIVKTGERSRVSVEELSAAVGHLTASSDQVTVEVQRIAIATESFAPGMQQLEATLVAAEDRFAQAERAAQDGWRTVGADIAKRLDVIVRPQHPDERRELSPSTESDATIAADRDVVRLLESIAARVARSPEAQQPSMWRTAVGPLLGVLIGSAIVAGATRLF